MFDSDMLNFDHAARELMRAVRGDRSQAAFARRLGYRGNPVGSWEAGRRAPTGQEALAACELVGINVRQAFARFHAAAPPERAAREDLADWFERVRGRTSIVQLSRRGGCSRHQLTRWLKGHAEPRLPDLLRLVEALTGRASDLVAELVPIERVPSMMQNYRKRSSARRLAYEEPWTEAIVRVLESDGYRRLASHKSGYVAEYLGISREVEERGLEKLLSAGVVAFTAGRYEATGSLTVDTRAMSELRAHWARTALERIPNAHDEDLFSYNVFSVSTQDLTRVRELLRATFREIRVLIADTSAEQEVALFNLQLVHWPRPPVDS